LVRRPCFEHPFKHPITGAEQRICNFVLVNAGTFSSNATDNFFADATNREHGGHVRLFDGKALLDLDRWATVARVEQLGEMLAGLLYELNYNRIACTCIESRLVSYLADPHAKLGLPLERCRVWAFSHYVQRPFLQSQIDFTLANRYLTSVSEYINRALDVARISANKREMLQEVVDAIRTVRPDLELLAARVAAVQKTIGPLAAV
jgi:hypothetical protein